MVNEVIKLDKPIMTKTGKVAAELDRPGKTDHTGSVPL